MTTAKVEEERSEILERMREHLVRRMPEDGVFATPLECLRIARHDDDRATICSFYATAVALIVQGCKSVIVGGQPLVYAEGQCLLTNVDMPSSFRISGTAPGRPFLAVSMTLDRQQMTQLLSVLGESNDCRRPRPAVTSDADPELLSAFLRLLEVSEKPQQAAILAPGIIREVHYRLLSGPMGPDMRRFCTAGSLSCRIAEAVTWLRQNFREPLQIEDLARRVKMAPSTFHRHFKEVTSVSPLQFHKRLRLCEAQRLMLSGEADAASAGFAVGYASATQFSREYKRLFGDPPRRDVMHRLGY